MTSATLSGSTTAPAKPAPATRTHYEASGGRKVFYALTVLILSPFFVSLPVMLYQRISRGVWFDTWGLTVLAVGFAIIMYLLLAELLNSVRSKIDIGETSVRYSLPWRTGAVPFLFQRKGEIAYTDIERVETRREIYGRPVAPVFMRGARIVKKDGTAVTLGYVNDTNVDPAFPFADIAAEIARRADVPFVDLGNVHRRLAKKILGIRAADSDPIPNEEIDRLNGQHDRLMIALVGFLAVLVAVGLTLDFLGSSINRGERARDAVVVAPQPASPAPAKK